MKKKGVPALVTLIVVVLLWFAYLRPSLQVATAYTAKYVCSSTFLSNLSDENIARALDMFLVRSVTYAIDSTNKQVDASFLGLGQQTARYYENANSCGCVLGTPDFAIAEVAPSSPWDESSETLWPQGDKMHDTLPDFIDVAQLDTIVTHTLDANPGTLAITVAYKNLLVAEAYNKGVDKSTRLLGWSMTKGIGNALMGILEKSNAIAIDSTPKIATWQGDARKEITINHLLQMSSGLQWTEEYTKLSDVTTMLYLTDDVVDYALQSKATKTPDEEWLYSSGTTNLLSLIIRAHFERYEQYLTFPYDSLFQQLGMSSATIELDNAGNHILSSYAWATARDWTRFGLLYLYKGAWFGKQIFSEDWVSYSTTPASTSNGLYGAQLWLNTQGERLPSVPRDAFYENGFGGQRILVIPSKDMVITVLSGNQPHFDFDSFYVDVFNCFAE